MTQNDDKAGVDEMSAERAGRMAVKHRQDYSELPQKTITLKEGIGGLVAPSVKPAKRPAAQAPTRPEPKTKKGQTAKKPRKSATQWTLRGVSAAAREVALNAAREEGIPLGAWLERAIFKADIPADKTEYTQQPLFEALADIQTRLERLEHRLDWPSRLKEYLKSWLG